MQMLNIQKISLNFLNDNSNIILYIVYMILLNYEQHLDKISIIIFILHVILIQNVCLIDVLIITVLLIIIVHCDNIYSQ